MAGEIHKPGPSPNDLCAPGKKGAELFNSIKIHVESREYSPPSIHLVFAVFHIMGMPRAWQLACLDELHDLPREHKVALQKAAQDALRQMKPGEKYLFIWEPYPNVTDEHFATMDLTDETSTEKLHWPWTIPGAFVERLARLGD